MVFSGCIRGHAFLGRNRDRLFGCADQIIESIARKEITKIGSRTMEKVDLRIVAATNMDLLEEIRKKNFREDLYYRLTVVEIKVPPLRDRKSDIPLLVDKFLQKYGMEYRDRLLRIDPEALKILERYPWPGNIRELENVVQRAVIMADGPIGVKDLPDFLKYDIDFPEEEFMPLRNMEKNISNGYLYIPRGTRPELQRFYRSVEKRFATSSIDSVNF